MARKKAFTLIELLVVISVVAVLLAILLPALGRVRKQARAAACQMNLRQWGTTLALYAQDHEGRFSRADYSAIWMLTGRDPHVPARLAGSFIPGANEPTPYHPIHTEGMLCPTATKACDGPDRFGATSTADGITWTFSVTYGTTFEAWVLTEPGPPLPVSYGANRWLFDRPVQHVPFAPPPPSYTNIYSLRRTAGIPLLLDSRAPYGLPNSETAPPQYEDVLPGRTGMRPFCIDRHSGYVNCLFLDWSVRKVGLKELWMLKWSDDFNMGGPWTQRGGVRPEDWPEWMRAFRDC